MPYLDLYTQPLTPRTAAHLLRRATFGPTQAEITAFSASGQTATTAVQTLIANANYTPTQPVDLEITRSTAGQFYLQNATTSAGQYLPFVGANSTDYGNYIKYWWMNLMIQPGATSLLDKLTLFWQNHFVTTRDAANDYRFVWSYLKLLRDNALGDFRTLVTKMSKEPAMLRYLNGDMNESGVGKANENYARELQELFTVGAFDFAGNANYTEDDVKNAARVLTGWKYSGYYVENSTSFTTTFTSNKHDSTNKAFSTKYGTNISISGRSGATAGDLELTDLVTMLLNHPQTSRFICRKLYRWYVNPNVTADIETNVIVPLAALFVSNNYNIRPVIEKLLTSQIFFDDTNIGAIVKSPVEFVVGLYRFYELPVPALTPTVLPFKATMEHLYGKMRDQQLEILEQPTVFGYEPYYQTGYSKLWANTGTIVLRNDFTNRLVDSYTVYQGPLLNINSLGRITTLQPDFGLFVAAPTTAAPSPAPTTAALTCVQVLDSFLLNLLATDLDQTQKDFLIDKIMMGNQAPRSTWEFEWNLYRRTVTYPTFYSSSAINNAKNAVNNRLKNLMKYLLRLAEYHIM
jgi:uncharacterized protein (DUF1800 family)